ncbi:hypothetical protein KM043_006896 [Ampulex compressa]|nr:hypothetical protein KM043_006896 [Ampulex compressa]
MRSKVETARMNTHANVRTRVNTLGGLLDEERHSGTERKVLLMQPHDRKIAMRRRKSGSKEDPGSRRGASSRAPPRMKHFSRPVRSADCRTIDSPVGRSIIHPEYHSLRLQGPSGSFSSGTPMAGDGKPRNTKPFAFRPSELVCLVEGEGDSKVPCGSFPVERLRGTLFRDKDDLNNWGR